MRIRTLEDGLLAVLGLLVCSSLLGFTDHQEPAQDPGTWILQIEGDAKALAVKHAAHKPFAHRAPRGIESDHRVRLLDAKGTELASVPLDLSRFCTDEDHVGKPAHLHGDVITKHAIVCTVKVPAHADVAEIRIENAADTAKPVLLGKIDSKALRTLLDQRDAQKRKVQKKEGK